MKPTTKAKQRDSLDEIIGDVQDALRRLKAVRAQMHNRPALKGRRTAKATRSVASGIRAYHRMTPGASMQEIAQLYNVSVGRVSELLRGKRT